MHKNCVERNRTNNCNQNAMKKLVIYKFVLAQFMHMKKEKNLQLSTNN